MINRKTGKIYKPVQLNLLSQYAKEATKFAAYIHAVAKELACDPRQIPSPDLIMQMRTVVTVEQLARGTIGRNDPCPCDSGSKFKKCCMVL